MRYERVVEATIVGAFVNVSLAQSILEPVSPHRVTTVTSIRTLDLLGCRNLEGCVALNWGTRKTCFQGLRA